MLTITEHGLHASTICIQLNSRNIKLHFMAIAPPDLYQLLIRRKKDHFKKTPNRDFYLCGHYNTSTFSQKTSVVYCLPVMPRNVQGHTCC